METTAPAHLITQSIETSYQGSLKIYFCIVYLDSVLGTICKRIGLPTPVGTQVEN